MQSISEFSGSSGREVFAPPRAINRTVQIVQVGSLSRPFDEFGTRWMATAGNKRNDSSIAPSFARVERVRRDFTIDMTRTVIVIDVRCLFFPEPGSINQIRDQTNKGRISPREELHLTVNLSLSMHAKLTFPSVRQKAVVQIALPLGWLSLFRPCLQTETEKSQTFCSGYPHRKPQT